MEIVFDAQNKKLGRLASEAASVLMGKNRTDFSRNRVPQIKVVVKNASKLSITDKKKSTKIYRNYSGYPGGLKDRSLKYLIQDHGMKEAFRIAVRGMLPKNKLRDRMMKNLVVTD